MASVDRGRYGCLVGDEPIIAMQARELGRRSVVVGDRVALAGDISGAQGTLARIVRVRPRTSVLRRSADDTDPVERVIVANADQLVIVCALANPPPRVRFIDRCLVAAYDAGLAPLLCLTKADLASPDDVLSAYEPLGFPCVVTSRPLREDVLDDVQGPAGGTRERAHRSVGCGQVHTGQRADAGGRAGGGRGQPGHRPGQAHVFFGRRPQAGPRPAGAG